MKPEEFETSSSCGTTVSRSIAHGTDSDVISQSSRIP